MSAGLVAGLLGACGGPSAAPPPASPEASLAPEAPAGESAKGPTASDGPAASASSEEVRRAITAIKAGDFSAARATLEAAIARDPKHADAHHYLGVVLEQAGNKAQAEASYRRALALQPDLEESTTNLSALLIESGKFDDAVALTKRALTKGQKNASLWLNLATALSGKGDVDGANKAFEEALRLEPSNGSYLLTYASHLGRAGRHVDAVSKLREAERVGAADPGLLAAIALEHKAQRDFRACREVLDRAIALNDVAELRIYRGACKLALKDLAGATADFKHAVDTEPKSALAHYSLGNALADSGKMSEAVSEWQACIAAASGGTLAQAAEKKITMAKTKGQGSKRGGTPKK